MELLIAFLIAFGVVTADDARSLKSEADTKELVTKHNLDKEFIIWDAEADDF